MGLLSLRARILNRKHAGLPGPHAEELRHQIELLQGMPELRGLLDSLPDMMLLLNSKRQIVFANQWMLKLLCMSSVDLLGMKPGDVLDCSRAWEESTKGCTLGEACQACGASKAIRICENGQESAQECRILQSSSGVALDLRALTKPLHLAGEPFTLLVLKDIASEKRRQALERLFFHDMLNMAASIMGYAELLTRVRPEEIPELSQLLARLIADLAAEIRAQRDLMLAERDDLVLHWQSVGSRTLLTEAMEACRSHETSGGGMVAMDASATEVQLETDRSLLSRVLCNLIKNALEASPSDRVVTVGCQVNGPAVEFWVHNAGTMTRDVQLQIFQRSFSTKGPGRGLGTYSIKLLTERYLGGQVTFSTSANDGTRFVVSYPCRHAAVTESSAQHS